MKELLFERVCTLKVISEYDPEKLYSEIKAKFEDLIIALNSKGYWYEKIKIEFDDEKQQIYFGYNPKELDALINVLPQPHQLKGNIRYPFDKVDDLFGFQTISWDRYQLTYKTDVEKCVEEIKTLCRQYDELVEHLSKENKITAVSPYLPQNTFKNRQERFVALRNYLVEQCSNNQIRALFFGEIHHHKYPKRFLPINMSFFKKLGFGILCIEFLNYKEHQQYLDQYFKGNNSELPNELLYYLQDMDRVSRSGISGYVDVLKAAKQANIRVIASDRYESILSAGELKNRLRRDKVPKARLKTFAVNAYKIIEKETQGQSFLFYDGGRHSDKESTSNIKSLAELWPNSCSIELRDEPMTGYGKDSFPFFNPLIRKRNNKSYKVDIADVNPDDETQYNLSLL